jgi:poly-gamma-glutamate capsule biosynthesis protein CapA/YwtB (metallophosphatase superfamily)
MQEEVDGQPVVYSLGNLIFDGGTAAAGWWLHGELLEVNLGPKGQILRTRTIPVTLGSGVPLRP